MTVELGFILLQGSFNWGEAILALAILALVLGGLVMMEAVHQGASGRRKGTAAPQTAATAAATTVASPAASRVAWGRALLAGLVATAFMTAFYFILAAVGLPQIDPGAMLASVMNDSLLLGWGAHLMIGIVLGLIYAWFFADALPGPVWARGATFSLLPFLIAQVIVIPLMGGGFFSVNMPQTLLVLLVSLVGHLLYGAVLALVYTAPSEDEPAPSPVGE